MEILTALRLVGPDDIFSIVPEKTVICDIKVTVAWDGFSENTRKVFKRIWRKWQIGVICGPQNHL
jgi:hypothetical protein